MRYRTRTARSHSELARISADHRLKSFVPFVSCFFPLQYRAILHSSLFRSTPTALPSTPALRAISAGLVTPAHKHLNTSTNSGTCRRQKSNFYQFFGGCPVPSAAVVCRCMSITEIRELPLKEKLQFMESLWEDLRCRDEAVPVPEWHKELLDARRKAAEAGQEHVLEWDDVKHSLGTPPA